MLFAYHFRLYYDEPGNIGNVTDRGEAAFTQMHFSFI
jgi:hypothetical protein